MKRIIFFLIFSSFTIVNAQVREMMLNKANEKLKQKQSEKAASDTTGVKPDEEAQKEKTSPSFNFTGVPRSEIRAEYSFSDNIQAEVKSYKKNGELDGEPQQVKYLFSKEPYLGMEIKTVDKKEKSTSVITTIAEFEKSITVILTDDGASKTGFAMKHDYNKIMEEANDTTKYRSTITKTGRKKVILGYNCEEYIITNQDNEKSEVWQTSEIPLDLFKSIQAFAKGNAGMNGYPQGFMMEMTQFSSKGEKLSEWNVIAVNLNAPSKIRSADYTFAGF